MILLLSACSELTEDSKMNGKENETIKLLADIYPDTEFEFIFEEEDELQFYADGEMIKIKELNQDEFFVETAQLNFNIKYNTDPLILQEYITENKPSDLSKNKPSDLSKKKPISLEVFDKDMNSMGEFVGGMAGMCSEIRSVSTLFNHTEGEEDDEGEEGDDGNEEDENEDYDEDEICVSGNVVDCISDHCEDAGAILCTGCLISKYCLAALTVWCGIDVALEVDNELYCD